MPKPVDNPGNPLPDSERVAVIVEPREGIATDDVSRKLAELGATDIEELVPGMWSAVIEAVEVPKLQKLAGVSIMDRKFMRA